ncbi:MAG: COX15/CtaA family protein [Burkholderiaceae bacterium]
MRHASFPFYRRLIAVTVVLTLALVMLGAYVRLSDAGLGCPDWPGCYGHLTPARASDHIARAVEAQGGEHGPVSMGKAWREMLHRYFASGLGLLIIAIAVIAWRQRARLGQSPWLATALVGIVVLQGLFGKWTVTLLLKPAIVTGHLIGGLLTLAILVWLWERQNAGRARVDAEAARRLRLASALGFVLLAAQIFLGGWTSTNYAALACPDLPTCQGQWLPDTNFADAFHLVRELGMTGDGEMLPMQALTAIHLSHRIGAVVVALYLGWLAWRASRVDGLQPLGAALMAVLLAQLVLGISNVLLSLPLPVAVAHNGGAAVLVTLMVMLNYRVGRAGRAAPAANRSVSPASHHA